MKILKDTADNISLLRVGEEFGTIIGEFGEEFFTRATRFRPNLDSQNLTVAQLGDIISQKPDIRIYKRIPLSTKDNIMSWAFDESFDIKPPCMLLRKR